MLCSSDISLHLLLAPGVHRTLDLDAVFLIVILDSACRRGKRSLQLLQSSSGSEKTSQMTGGHPGLGISSESRSPRPHCRDSPVQTSATRRALRYSSAPRPDYRNPRCSPDLRKSRNPGNTKPLAFARATILSIAFSISNSPYQTPPQGLFPAAVLPGAAISFLFYL